MSVSSSCTAPASEAIAGLTHTSSDVDRSVAGTTIARYNAFLQQLFAMIPQIGAANFVQRYVMHDNLRSHLTVRITNTIHAAGHRVVPRPPYRPCDAPCEFAFNTLQCELDQRAQFINTAADLAREVGNILQGLGPMDAYFVHCGYQ